MAADLDSREGTTFVDVVDFCFNCVLFMEREKEVRIAAAARVAQFTRLFGGVFAFVGRLSELTSARPRETFRTENNLRFEICESSQLVFYYYSRHTTEGWLPLKNVGSNREEIVKCLPPWALSTGR